MKKNKKKGFTLVELLAVIVVLAIILVIAVPKILDVIKSSRENSLISSVKLVARNAEQKLLTNEVLGESTDTLSCAEVADLSENDYASCTIEFDEEGNATVSITGKGKFNGYTCSGTKNNVTCSKNEPITITFDANGGKIKETNETTTQKVYTGMIEYGILPKVNAPDDKVFIGWYTDKINGTKVEKNTPITNSASHILYAHYSEYVELSSEWKDTLIEKYPSIAVDGYTAIEKISFYNNENGNYTSDKEFIANISNTDETIKAYLKLNTITDRYELDIVGDKLIAFPKNSHNLFSGMYYLMSFDSNNSITTSNVENMSYIFAESGVYAETFNILGLDTWDVSNVTDMSYMLYGIGKNAVNFNLNLGDWDVSNVENMSMMFQYAGINAENFTLNLSSWDTSNVTNMYNMFYGVGENAGVFNLNLSGWDTSGVTSMSNMFQSVGINADDFTLNLSNWNTSNVTNMSSMFSDSGENSGNFALNLSGWDISNVTRMSDMFYHVGESSVTLTLNLSNWKISNDFNMASIFMSTGEDAGTIELNMSNWDTSNITDMSEMFSELEIGKSKLDVSGWNTSQVTNMSRMFYGSHFDITGLNTWDVSNVENMSSMFMYAGVIPFVLDLSTWDTSKVENMSSMFEGTGDNESTWRVIIPKKTGTQDNTTSKWYGKGTTYASPDTRSFTLASE